MSLGICATLPSWLCNKTLEAYGPQLTTQFTSHCFPVLPDSLPCMAVAERPMAVLCWGRPAFTGCISHPQVMLTMDGGIPVPLTWPLLFQFQH